MMKTTRTGRDPRARRQNQEEDDGPLMYPQREDGPHYQTAWDAFTGLFDKDRKKKPIRPPQHSPTTKNQRP